MAFRFIKESKFDSNSSPGTPFSAPRSKVKRSFFHLSGDFLPPFPGAEGPQSPVSPGLAGALEAGSLTHLPPGWQQLSFRGNIKPEKYLSLLAEDDSYKIPSDFGHTDQFFNSGCLGGIQQTPKPKNADGSTN